MKKTLILTAFMLAGLTLTAGAQTVEKKHCNNPKKECCKHKTQCKKAEKPMPQAMAIRELRPNKEAMVRKPHTKLPVLKDMPKEERLELVRRADKREIRKAEPIKFEAKKKNTAAPKK